MKTVAVVTPAFYKPHLTPEEKISLKASDKYLGGYDKYFIVPERLDIKKNKRKGYHFIKFPNEFFVNTKTYNKLLLSEIFYKKFSGYKYILIYQLDALVFSDELLQWCKSGYDYIASPWIHSNIGFLTHKDNSPVSGGNGGFCLRNVRNSLEVLNRVNIATRRTSSQDWVRKLWFCIAVITGQSHKIWLNAPADNYPFNEDGFWALEATKYLPTYKVAPFNKALKFGFEKLPRRLFEINNSKLPFGCHAWEKYDKAFWVPFTEQF